MSSIIFLLVGVAVGIYTGVVLASRDMTRWHSRRDVREPLPLKVWRRD